MTHEEVMERVREDVLQIIRHAYSPEDALGKILSIPRLRVEDPDQSLPDMVFPSKFSSIQTSLLLKLRDHIVKYLKADNWKRVLPKEEKDE